MDYFGTEGPDVVDQVLLGITEYLTYRLLGGNDVARLQSGLVQGGSGNDEIRSIDDNGSVEAAYWDSPAGVVADLAAGYADDGYGTRDVLVGVRGLHGSWRDDRFYGSGNDERFFPNGGGDYIDGRGGIDVVGIPNIAEFSLRVSLDGTSATLTRNSDPRQVVELVNIEVLQLGNWPDVEYRTLASFIDPLDQARLGLLADDANRWNAGSPLGTPTEVTFSFVTTAPSSGPGSTGFRPFTEAERALLRDVLADTAAVSGLSFSEITESDATVGQLRFGVSQQLTTKGVSYLPNHTGAADEAGDVWMDAESMIDLSPGSEGYAALLHEVGHALGLRHPRNVDSGDNYTNQLRLDDDTQALTVMSGTPGANGLFRADWGLIDLIALRHLYGAEDLNTGNNTYSITATASGNRLIVDDGGIDTLDASASTAGVTIDLRPTHFSSIGRTPDAISAVDNIAIAHGSWIENAVGSVEDDTLIGNELANRLRGEIGNDLLFGEAGLDVAVFAGQRADYVIEKRVVDYAVSARDGIRGVDSLVDIERLQFGDRWVALDLEPGQAAGNTVRIIGAAFDGPANLQRPDWVGVGLDLFDSGMTMLQVCELAASILGQDDRTFVTTVYTNVVGVAPDTATRDSFVSLLQGSGGSMTQAELLELAANAEPNATNIDLVGLLAAGVDFV